MGQSVHPASRQVYRLSESCRGERALMPVGTAEVTPSSARLARMIEILFVDIVLAAAVNALVETKDCLGM
jgi:hypothetical protein